MFSAYSSHARTSGSCMAMSRFAECFRNTSQAEQQVSLPLVAIVAAEVVINDHQRWFDSAVADSPRFCVVYFDTLVLLPRSYTTFPMSNHKAVKAASGLFSCSCSHYPKTLSGVDHKHIFPPGEKWSGLLFFHFWAENCYGSSICMYLHVVLWLHA